MQVYIQGLPHDVNSVTNEYSYEKNIFIPGRADADLCKHIRATSTVNRITTPHQARARH